MKMNPRVPPARIATSAVLIRISRLRKRRMLSLFYPLRTRLLFASDYDRHVVRQFRRVGPLANGFHHGLDNLGILALGILGHQLDEPLLAEHLAVFVLRLRNAVGVAHQQIAALEL